MKFKKILYIPFIYLLGTSAFAGYMVQYPNQQVNFKNFGEWVQSEPTVTAWVNVGTPHDCTSAEPLENTKPLGLTYTKIFSGCQQSQERNVTTFEKHTVSGAIRNSVTNMETQVLDNVTYSTNAVGTKIVKECSFSNASGKTNRWIDAAKTNSPNYTTTYGMSVEWLGTRLFFNINTNKTYSKSDTFLSGDYIYTRGAYTSKSTYSEQNRLDYYYYELCREPVAP